MRRWCARPLRWLAQQLELLAFFLDPPSNALYLAARALTKAIQSQPISGEAKRHQVYAQLIKQFPGVPHRTIARTIESALS